MEADESDCERDDDRQNQRHRSIFTKVVHHSSPFVFSGSRQPVEGGFFQGVGHGGSRRPARLRFGWRWGRIWRRIERREGLIAGAWLGWHQRRKRIADGSW